MKRIGLFVATNLAVLLLLSIIVRALGMDAWLARQGMGLDGLLGFAALVGFGGALLSLALSKWTAKKQMGVRLITEPRTSDEAWLLDAVASHAERAGIAMPEVGIFDAAEMNAFATGARRDRALVAVSSGLLRGMTRHEAAAVLGHEIAHVANGDMVTLALIQGVVNTFVISLARIIGLVLDSALGGGREAERRRGIGPFYFLVVVVLQLVLGMFANLIVMGFSRQREFRADAGGARLAGTANMISALERLQTSPFAPLSVQLAAFGIAGDGASGLLRFFMSHPSLADRVAALRAAAARHDGQSVAVPSSWRGAR
ncbi:MAG TPA: protease HtpX [Burkholderiales bacterium]|nr:protease HtpX [Burkholderiales bacterium]